MKRSFDHVDQDSSNKSGMAMKFLFSTGEMQAAQGSGGSAIHNIEQLTGASITTNGLTYPGLTFPLQELKCSGSSTEVVLGAIIHVLAQILQETGCLTNGEEDVLPGDARLKTVVPTKAAAGIIGRGGDNIKQMRAVTGLHIHLDKSPIPPNGGDIAEQLVTLSGNLAGIQSALPMLAEQVALYAPEPWFPAWAESSNAGTQLPGIELEVDGKGMKGGGKGNAAGQISAPAGGGTSLAMSGELCQFFARSGWCKYGDECKHSHVVGAAAGAGGSVSQAPVVSVAPSGESCLFFAKSGWCKFGDNCKHSHQTGAPTANVSSPLAASPVTGFGKGALPAAVQPQEHTTEVCQFFARSGWCKYGDQCRYTHTGGAGSVQQPQLPQQPIAGALSMAPVEKSGEICNFFARSGWCKYGDACRHSHVLSQTQNANVPTAGPAGGQLQFAGSQQQSASGQQQFTGGPSPAPDSSGEVCQFFAQAGWCRHGDKCRHKHVANEHTPVPVPSGEICQFFARSGWCKFGDTCRHSHSSQVPESGDLDATLAALDGIAERGRALGLC